MKKEPRYKLGQIIEAKSMLLRLKDLGNKKYWQSINIKPTQVMIIGIRTLQDGHNEYLPDYGNVFYPESYLKALLVVENLNTKPFYIPMP